MRRASVLFLLFAVQAALLAAGPIVTRGVTLAGSEGTLEYNFTVPAFNVVTLDNGDKRIEMEGAGYLSYPGYPRLPMLSYTFALPPGAKLAEVDVLGNRSPIEGRYLIEASLPDMPYGADLEDVSSLFRVYEETRERVYSGQESFSGILGEKYASGERREYSLVTVACYPFSYDPVSGQLAVAKNFTIRLHYTPVDSEHQKFIARFIENGTLEADVPSEIYNRDEARLWYKPQERLSASPKMLILTTAAIKDSTSRYAYWRRSTGFEVDIVTVEDVLAASSGVDGPQKIRNWLRQNATSYDYLFIVGNFSNIPMRLLSAYSDGKTPDKTLDPSPSDSYYGDLSLPDDQSWNLDGDGYYAEMLTAGGFTQPQDAPDFEMELHVGRINSSNLQLIPVMLEDIWLFENSTNTTYKERSVLAGGILWYPNWNGSGTVGFDGATFMEYLTTNSIIKSSPAITLYEKEGKQPSVYSCDQPLTQANLKSSLKNNDVGVFVENNHGWNNSFARCVWSSDDGDNIPEDAEFTWPNGLASSDAYALNTTNPNVAFLLSCLNGYAEDANCLAQALLNYSSVAVVAHTRSALGSFGWTKPTDGGMGGLYAYVLDNYLKNSASYDYVLGDAVDAGRRYYYSIESGRSRFINTYEHTLFGDPALRHMGRTGKLPPLDAVVENAPTEVQISLTVDPVSNHILFSLPSAMNVRIEVWDVSGRRVQTLYDGTAKAGDEILSWDKSQLPKGSYFVTLKTENLVRTTKAVVIN